jgi:hypothetical protein
MVFPNWGALSANIVNSQNQKKSELIGQHIQIRKPTKKDWVIGALYMIIPAAIVWVLFIVVMYFSN